MPAAAAFGAAIAAGVAWNIVEGARAARSRSLSDAHRVLGALVAFLSLPALLLWVAGALAASARTVADVTWLWPLVAALACAQVVAAMVTRGARIAEALPVLAWNLVVLAVASVQYATRSGAIAPAAVQALVATQANLLAWPLGAVALVAPWAVAVPLIAGAHVPRSKLLGTARTCVVLAAAAGVAGFGMEYPHALVAIDGYDAMGRAQVTERGPNGIVVGLRVLPRLDGPPSASALREDLALADSLNAGALLVRVARTSSAGLDSLERAMEPYRRDSTLLLAASGAARGDVDRIVRRLHPDYLVLEHVSSVTAARAAADLAHTLRPATRVALAVAGPGGGSDSALVEWAAGPAGAVDALFFVLEPGVEGALRDGASLAAFDRWMAAASSRREFWVVAESAPATLGEEAQRQLARHVLAWASLRPAVRGVIFADAADYDQSTGIRSASGRWRPVAGDIAQMVRALAESFSPTTP